MYMFCKETVASCWYVSYRSHILLCFKKNKIDSDLDFFMQVNVYAYLYKIHIYIWLCSQCKIKIDGINLHFRQKKYNLHQTFNIPYSSAIFYCSVIWGVTRYSR